MKLILFEDNAHAQLYPLTLTRPVAELRIGILTVKEKWENYLKDYEIDTTVSREYLYPKFKSQEDASGDALYVNGRVLPTSEFIELASNLEAGQGIKDDQDQVLAYRGNEAIDLNNVPDFIWTQHSASLISYPEDIFTKNGEEMAKDFELLTAGRSSQPIPENNQCIEPQNIFLEEGAKVQCAILNASSGPIYIGKNAEIMEGSIVRGGLALCEGSTLKLGAKIYGPTTVGPHSKVGGEVNNSVIQGYSNKGHDGFLGNSVLGEWCNLGADTNTSNLKNNYAEVRLWDYTSKRFRHTGKQFCGLIMGDHSKCGINTMFNTGTVVGICSNIFGSGFPRNFVPSFAWGGASGFTTYKPAKVFEVAEVVMARRNKELSKEDIQVLEALFEAGAEERFWEKK